MILATIENDRTVKVVSMAKCSITRNLGIVKLLLLPRLHRPRIMERYLTSPEFEDVEPLLDHEGEPFIIREKARWRKK